MRRAPRGVRVLARDPGVSGRLIKAGFRRARRAAVRGLGVALCPKTADLSGVQITLAFHLTSIHL